ncbi:hypothetical protein SDC9_91245 [bioreactor metagenome]|uniref:Uncharacterized protein n=1 Tax=bioreactor metagenome TaxID=1076179 RepID=A0A644ZV20_9ZZZZ
MAGLRSAPSFTPGCAGLWGGFLPSGRVEYGFHKEDRPKTSPTPSCARGRNGKIDIDVLRLVIDFCQENAALSDFTEGSVSKKLIFFAAPLLLSSLAQQRYNTHGGGQPPAGQAEGGLPHPSRHLCHKLASRLSSRAASDLCACRPIQVVALHQHRRPVGIMLPALPLALTLSAS